MEVSKRIRNEHCKAHHLNQKKEFLLKTGFLHNNEEKQEPSVEEIETSNYERKVHLSYLNRIGTTSLPEENQGGEHQGA